MGAECREVLVLSETRRFMSFPDHNHRIQRTKKFVRAAYQGNKTKIFFLNEAVFCVYNKSEIGCHFSHLLYLKANRKLEWNTDVATYEN
jgi:hypothetical protein